MDLLFIFKTASANFKKNQKKINQNYTLKFHLRSSENSKNGLSMGNKDKKVVRKFATCGSYGVFLKKNVKKKGENVTCGGVFEERKKKKNIRGFLNEFSKNAQISPIGKADYLLTS